MRLLLITDTHGRLDHINSLAEATACDAVIHAGDLGFYDEQSDARLSERELNLRMIPSEVDEREKRRVIRLSADKKAAFVKERLPLSELSRYLNGAKRFVIPVETLLTVIETCRQQRRKVFAFLTQAAEAQLAHQSAPSLLPRA